MLRDFFEHFEGDGYLLPDVIVLFSRQEFFEGSDCAPVTDLTQSESRSGTNCRVRIRKKADQRIDTAFISHPAERNSSARSDKGMAVIEHADDGRESFRGSNIAKRRDGAFARALNGRAGDRPFDSRGLVYFAILYRRVVVRRIGMEPSVRSAAGLRRVMTKVTPSATKAGS